MVGLVYSRSHGAPAIHSQLMHFRAGLKHAIFNSQAAKSQAPVDPEKPDDTTRDRPSVPLGPPGSTMCLFWGISWKERVHPGLAVPLRKHLASFSFTGWLVRGRHSKAAFSGAAYSCLDHRGKLLFASSRHHNAPPSRPPIASPNGNGLALGMCKLG